MESLQERSLERITKSDLDALKTIARKVMKHFFNHNPAYKNYSRTLLAMALCQGAAKHYVDKKNGIKDFDIYFFFAHPTKSKTNIAKLGRCRLTLDSGPKRFGKHPDLPDFEGRKIDFMIRAIDKHLTIKFGKEPKKCIRAYLREGRTETSRKLAENAVVGLHPPAIFAKVLWK